MRWNFEGVISTETCVLYYRYLHTLIHTDPVSAAYTADKAPFITQGGGGGGVTMSPGKFKAEGKENTLKITAALYLTSPSLGLPHHPTHC